MTWFEILNSMPGDFIIERLGNLEEILHECLVDVCNGKTSPLMLHGCVDGMRFVERAKEAILTFPGRNPS